MQGLSFARAAAGLAAAFALALGAVPGWAVEPDVLPDALWWRAERAAALDTDPLEALGDFRGAALDVEWAPLYVGSDGARVERKRSALLVATERGRTRLGAALDLQGSTARGGGHWWLDAERPTTTSGSFGAHLQARRFAAAVSTSTRDGAFGVAAGLRARLAPNVSVVIALSRVPRVGRAFFELDDVEVTASGRWIERRQSWSLDHTSSGGVTIGVGQQTFDRSRDRSAPSSADDLEPALSWRSTSAHAGFPHGAWRIGMQAEYGDGREMIRVFRRGQAYATGGGPVSHMLVSGDFEHTRAPYRMRMWYGRWRGNAEAVVALWPFDALGAAAGTRQIAYSNGWLRHAGLSIDRTLRGASGVEGGVALWRIEPHASYQSWRTTLLGVGRSDPSSGAADVESVVAIGLRLGAAMRWSVARLHVEAVQWVPVWVQRARIDAPAAGEPGVGAPPAPDGSSRGDRGGTVVRLSVELAR